jgi:endonuclease YncB( thermonuclease family)
MIIHHREPGTYTAAASTQFQLCSSSNDRNCVIDGDTIRYAGEKIRLADIDAPEISSPKCASELELGQEAKHRLLTLMNAGSFEVAYIGGRDEDTYGRKLRVIKRNGQSLGDTLIAEGLARPWDGARRRWC